MPSHRGRHQKQSRLQKPDRRIDNQSKLRKQQSEEPVVASGPEQDVTMSQFAYSGYGNQGGSLDITPADALGTMGFVSDDLKRLLSMTDSDKSNDNAPQPQQQQQQQHSPLPVSHSPRASPLVNYQQSPLPHHQGLYGPVMMPPPFLMNNMSKPGQHPYSGIPNGPGMLPMFLPMNPGHPMNQTPLYPPQMHNAVPQPLAFAPPPVFQQQQQQQQHPVQQQQQQQQAQQTFQTHPTEQAQHAQQAEQVQQILQQKSEVSASGITQATKPPITVEDVVNNSRHAKSATPENKQSSKPCKEESRSQRSEGSSHSKTKPSKKKNNRKNDAVPPKQIPVVFSPSSAPSSRSSKGNNKKSNHVRSDSRPDDHSKCYAGATFATEAPQVTTLPKPSFV